MAAGTWKPRSALPTRCSARWRSRASGSASRRLLGTMNNLTLGGFDNRAGRNLPITKPSPEGWGPRRGAGQKPVHTHMTNSWNTPVEALENQYPLRVRRYQISAAGRRDRAPCGGDGLIREIEFLTPCGSPFSPIGGAGSLRLMRRPARTAGSNTLIKEAQLKLVPLARRRISTSAWVTSCASRSGGGPGQLDFFEAAGRFGASVEFTLSVPAILNRINTRSLALAVL